MVHPNKTPHLQKEFRMNPLPDIQNQTRNLENECFEYGYLLAQSFDSADINKCLYTLLEQGIYSFFITINKIDTKKKTNQEGKLKVLLKKYCQPRFNLNFEEGRNHQEPYKWLVTINQSLSALIFSEDVLKRILIYARSSVDKNAS